MPVGNREMKPAEHQMVKTYEKRHGKFPTETDFAETYLRGLLEVAGFGGDKVQVVPVKDNNGDRILDALFDRRPELLSGSITVVTNAPNAIQAAGQLRAVARRTDEQFDSDGDQLFMVSDSIQLARRGEAPKTHQNPETALVQLMRNALFLQRNIPIEG